MLACGDGLVDLSEIVLEIYDYDLSWRPLKEGRIKRELIKVDIAL
jgi:hypothetical protein